MPQASRVLSASG